MDRDRAYLRDSWKEKYASQPPEVTFQIKSNLQFLSKIISFLWLKESPKNFLSSQFLADIAIPFNWSWSSWFMWAGVLCSGWAPRGGGSSIHRGYRAQPIREQHFAHVTRIDQSECRKKHLHKTGCGRTWRHRKWLPKPEVTRMSAPCTPEP